MCVAKTMCFVRVTLCMSECELIRVLVWACVRIFNCAFVCFSLCLYMVLYVCVRSVTPSFCSCVCVCDDYLSMIL